MAGIFDPAIFDPAIFDVVSGVAPIALPFAHLSADSGASAGRLLRPRLRYRWLKYRRP